MRDEGAPDNEHNAHETQAMTKESIRRPSHEGQQEDVWNRQAGTGVPDLDGQDDGESTVPVDRTVLDNTGVQRLISARNAGRQGFGQMGKRVPNKTILWTHST